MKSLKYCALILLIAHQGFAQELLTKGEAVKMALEFNYDIKVANNDVAIATNNASIKNNSYLPTLSVQGNSNYINNDVKRFDDEGFAFNRSGSQNYLWVIRQS